MNIDDRLQDEESDDFYEGPSKSQKKREAEALQKLRAWKSPSKVLFF